MNASTVLRAARELIAEPARWCKSDAQNPGRMSALRAVVNVGGPGQWDAMLYLRKAMATDLITVWNDHPGRTHSEVMSAFDDAIALAEGDGK